jgi:hypothetical protein
MRAKHLLCALLLSGLAGFAVGCGSDSKNDANQDMTTAGDGAGIDMGKVRTFEDYVIDLIDNHTSPTATPDDVATNAFGLPDTQLQSDFAKYFP